MGKTKKYTLSRENLLIECDRPVSNKYISSARLFLFDKDWNFERFYYTVILFYYIN